MGAPPDPPFKVCAALNGRPEGGRRAPRPGTGPPKFAAREQGRCCPGARCCPCCFSGPGLVPIVRAPRARPAPRARGRWHMPGRGPAARGAGAVNGLLPSGGETEEKRPAGRSPAADAAPAQFAGAPFLAGEAAPFRKLMHFLVKFACPPPPVCYTGGRSKDLTKIEERPPARRPFTYLDNIGGNCRAATFEIGAFSELFAAARWSIF